jgi:hypothetical protein
MGDKYIGIIGTLTGVILGWILGKIKVGNLNIHFDEIKDHFFPPENGYRWYEVNFVIKLDNDSEVNKVIRDFKLKFKTKSGEIFYGEVYSIKQIPNGRADSKFDIFNIPAKSSIDIPAKGSSSDIDKLLETKKIYFLYRNRGMRFKKKLLKKVDYSKQP